MMNGRLIIMSFPNYYLYNLKPRLIFFISIFLFPWLVIIGYAYISGGGSVFTSELMKNLPVLILLIPFLSASKPQNTEFKYLPAVRHNYVDLILTILFFILSVIVVIVLIKGLVIKG